MTSLCFSLFFLKIFAFSYEKEGKDLEELSLEEYRKFSDLVEEDIYDAISLESCVKNRKTKGAPGALWD